ncbi:hypothetical protein NHX12_020040 [Muraenolepis orangiensis]|uniref:ATP-dependent RNA helicase n=1 Tax=Muraenolepis orangiensis TaxID=630683 RepID=A0A9Q0IWL4_9TELE|nr:hypothetical protein NHX12_020040 [Muraenolepis orangiensis]
MKTNKGTPVKKNRFTKKKKSDNRGIHIQGKWKAVDLDPSIFSDEGMDGLMCFEELADYSLVDSEYAPNLLKKDKTARKRKSSETENDDEDLFMEDDDGDQESDKPIKKKKKTKKGNVSKDAKPDNSSADADGHDEVLVSKDKEDDGASNEENSGCADSKTVQSEVEKIDKKKKKKKKKKQKATETVSESKVEGEVNVLAKEQPSQDKPKKLPKSKPRNWTNVAVSDSNNQNTDVSAWMNLFVPAPVLKALRHLGFSSPTPIQALALPSAIRDRMDIVGAAETGSGKTLSFAIPMIHTILEWKKSVLEKDGVDEPASDLAMASQAIPHSKTGDDADSVTEELAVQVKHHIDAVAQFTDIKTAIIVGGMSQQKQSRMLRRQPEIVIATPGRLWELIREEHPHLLTLRHLKCLVIDEADRMVERGHFAELESLLEMLSTTHFNPKRQMFVFSATLTMASSVPSRLMQKKKKLDKRSKLEVLMHKVGIRSKPKVIDLTRKEATVETLTETQIQCVKDDKDFYLYYFLLQYPGRTMVFANSIDCIKRLNCLLVILDCTPLPLHANMHQKQRLKNLERFAERESCVLLTTDVAARGLDIPNVQHVLHYQVPRTSETYVHRSGRTARATKDGLSLLLVSPDDMLNFKKIYRSLGKDEEEVSMFPIQTKCMDAIKERVNLARQIEKIEYHNGKEKSHNSWFRQAAEALEVDLDDDVLMGRGRDEHEDRQQQKMVKGMKQHLKYLLSQPVFKNDIKTKYPTQMGKLSLPIMPRAGVESAITSVSKQCMKQRPKKAKQQH